MPNAEKDACDGCQKRPCVCETVVLPTVEKDAGPIIRHDAPEIGGQLDEFIADNASIHFEAMGEAQFWIGVTLADGRVFHINCGAMNARAKGYARCDEDDPTTPIPPGSGTEGEEGDAYA